MRIFTLKALTTSQSHTSANLNDFPSRYNLLQIQRVCINVNVHNLHHNGIKILSNNTTCQIIGRQRVHSTVGTVLN